MKNYIIIFLILINLSLGYLFFRDKNTQKLVTDNNNLDFEIEYRNGWDYYNYDIYTYKVEPNFKKEFYTLNYNTLDNGYYSIGDELLDDGLLLKYKKDKEKTFKNIILFNIYGEKYVFLGRTLDLLSDFENKNYVTFKNLENYDFIEYGNFETNKNIIIEKNLETNINNNDFNIQNREELVDELEFEIKYRNGWDYYNYDYYTYKVEPNFKKEFYTLNYDSFDDGFYHIGNRLIAENAILDYKLEKQNLFKDIVIFEIDGEKYVYLWKTLTLLSDFENKNHVTFKNLENYIIVN